MIKCKCIVFGKGYGLFSRDRLETAVLVVFNSITYLSDKNINQPLINQDFEAQTSKVSAKGCFTYLFFCGY